MAYRNVLFSLLSVFLLLSLLTTTIDAHGLKGAAAAAAAAAPEEEEVISYHRQLFADQIQAIINVLQAVVTLGGLISQLLALLGLTS
jgi:hypothetical protein